MDQNCSLDVSSGLALATKMPEYMIATEETTSQWVTVRQ